MQLILFLTMICTFVFSGVANAERILFVPLDNRPVCYEYVLDTIRKADFTIKAPPAEMLPSGRQNGDVHGMLNWLKREARHTDAIVLSTDALIYGGLVASRTHELPMAELEQRVKSLLDIIGKLNVEVYAYSTIMRTPRMSSGRVEPPYYAEYGAQIFRYTQLQDMSETVGLNRSQRKEYKQLTNQIPAAVLQDWQSRRDKNLRVNELLIQAAKDGKFDYFVLGKDDTSKYSASHRDARILSKCSAGLALDKYANFVGADQLGMVLCMRAITDFKGILPFVYAQYNQGVGADTMPTYEDTQVGDTVKSHIWALGGYPTKFLDRADLVLMINTPINGKTLEASSPINSDYNPRNKPIQFVKRTQHYMGKGYPTAIADVAYGNGADNALMQQVFNNNIEYQLAAYAGWNTASNTLGYAMVQGLLAKDMSAINKDKVILVRYADDWGYQANVRAQIYSSIVYPQGLNGQDLGTNTPRVQVQVQTSLRQFIGQYTNKFSMQEMQVTLPWDRMFEVYVKIE